MAHVARPVLRSIATTALLLGATSLTALLALPAAANSSPTPTVKVSPSHHLADGQTVTVTASGITPGATVRLNECDTFDDQADDDCPDLATATATAAGNLSTTVALKALVFKVQEIGDDVPVYCRNDGCQLFLVWPGSGGADQVLGSAALQFQGAEAHIHVKPSTHLYQRQMVDVHGSVYGAQHQKIQILEEACYAIAQGSGCYGALPPVKTRVSGHGTYNVSYEARRLLSDGTDCNDPDILGSCEITVVVDNSAGEPDDTFGLSSIGQPGVPVSFRAQPVGPTS